MTSQTKSESFFLEGLEASKSFAKDFAKEIDQTKNTILLFKGGMGVGKTTFIRMLGEALGVTEKITSPTFLGQNEYYSGQLALVHLDLYQAHIEYPDLEELINEAGAKLIAIEWSENFSESFISKIKQDPENIILELEIELDPKNDSNRKFTFKRQS